MWEKEEINIGDVEVGEKYTVTFKYNGDLSVLKISTSCGCTVPKIENNKVVVIYTPKPGKTYPYECKRYIFINHDNVNYSKLYIKSTVYDQI